MRRAMAAGQGNDEALADLLHYLNLPAPNAPPAIPVHPPANAQEVQGANPRQPQNAPGSPTFYNRSATGIVYYNITNCSGVNACSTSPTHGNENDATEKKQDEGSRPKVQVPALKAPLAAQEGHPPDPKLLHPEYRPLEAQYAHQFEQPKCNENINVVKVKGIPRGENMGVDETTEFFVALQKSSMNTNYPSIPPCDIQIKVEGNEEIWICRCASFISASWVAHFVNTFNKNGWKLTSTLEKALPAPDNVRTIPITQTNAPAVKAAENPAINNK